MIAMPCMLRGRNPVALVPWRSFSSRPRKRPEIALHLPVNFLRPLFVGGPVLSPKHPRTRTGAMRFLGWILAPSGTLYHRTGAKRSSGLCGGAGLGLSNEKKV